MTDAVTSCFLVSPRVYVLSDARHELDEFDPEGPEPAAPGEAAEGLRFLQL